MENNKISADNRNIFIDQIKFIAAIFVVFIHASFPGFFGDSIDAVAKFAVPFFFIVSGYFFYNNDSAKMVSSVKNKILNILKIIFVAYLLNAIRITIQNMFSVKKIIIWLKQDVFTIKHLVEFALLNNSAFSGVMWFLFALIYCYVLYAIAAKFNILKIIYITSIAALIFKIICNDFTLLEFLPNVRFLFSGFPFFGIGMLIKKFHDQISKINAKYMIGLLTVSLVFVIVERSLVGEHELSAGAAIIAICLFFIAVLYPNGIGNKHSKPYIYIYNLGRNNSLWIYILHPLVIHLVKLLYNVLNIKCELEKSYLYPIVVCVITVILSDVVYRAVIKVRSKK